MRNKIKIFVNCFIASIISYTFFYLVFGFVNNNYDATQWEETARAGFIIVSFIMTLVLCFLLNEQEY